MRRADSQRGHPPETAPTGGEHKVDRTGIENGSTIMERQLADISDLRKARHDEKSFLSCRDLFQIRPFFFESGNFE